MPLAKYTEKYLNNNGMDYCLDKKTSLLGQEVEDQRGVAAKAGVASASELSSFQSGASARD